MLVLENACAANASTAKCQYWKMLVLEIDGTGICRHWKMLLLEIDDTENAGTVELPFDFLLGCELVYLGNKL